MHAYMDTRLEFNLIKLCETHEFVESSAFSTVHSILTTLASPTFTKLNTDDDNDVSCQRRRHTCDLNMCWAPHRSVGYVKTGFDLILLVQTDATNDPDFC